MCGRFALTLPQDAVAGWFDAVQAKAGPAQPRANICPSQMVDVVVQHAQKRQIVPMRWGFIPKWFKAPNDGPMLINARSETLAEKPAFRAAFQTRRCLIAASGYYEWQKTDEGKKKWYVSAANEALLGFAGIWQAWQGLDGRRQITCAIVTCAAGPEMRDLHPREPVVIGPDAYQNWLTGASPAPQNLLQAAQAHFYTCTQDAPLANSR